MPESVITTLYGGCWRCHDRDSLRRHVRRPGLRAEECIDQVACQQRIDEQIGIAAWRASARDAVQKALAVALGGAR